MTQPYELLIEATSHAERKNLPGHIRQQVKRTIRSLALEPRPHTSETMDVAGLDVPRDIELRRIKLEHWRIVYAVNDVERWVWIWGVRKRPPYNYQDLTEFASKL